jgi:hypothetical protein
MATLAELKKKNQKSLLKFVFEETGVQLPADTSREELIQYATREGLVDVDDSDGEELVSGGTAKPAAEKTFDPLDGATHVTILVHEDEDNTLNYVQASDEMGNNNRIQKGVEAKVKIGVFHSLNDAVSTRYIPKTTENGELVMQPVRRHVHPFNIVQYHYEGK